MSLSKFDRKPISQVGVGDYMRGPRGPWRIFKVDWSGSGGTVRLSMRDFTGREQSVEFPTDVGMSLEVMSLLEVLALESKDTGS